MIAMQYSFVLPADYDMSIVKRRVDEKGHLLDDFPDLKFKAYLIADRKKNILQSAENLYAPFYVWNSGDGMNEFLCGAGFVGLSQSFGWPSVKSWLVWEAHLIPSARDAVFATREILMTPPYASLSELRKRESESAIADVESGGAVGSIAAFEPTTWSRVRFRLWGQARKVMPRDGLQTYDIGHMSTPGLTRSAPPARTVLKA